MYNATTDALIATIDGSTGFAPEFLLTTGVTGGQTYSFQVATVTEAAEGAKSDALSIIACSSPIVNTTLVSHVAGNKVFNATGYYTAGVDNYNLTFQWPDIFDNGGCAVVEQRVYLEQETATSETVNYNSTINVTVGNDTSEQIQENVVTFAGETESYLDITEDGTLEYCAVFRTFFA